MDEGKVVYRGKVIKNESVGIKRRLWSGKKKRLMAVS